MPFQFALLIPLACAFAYVVGALMVKRAAALGVDVWRSGFISNGMLALLFVPFWFRAGENVSVVGAYWQPALAGLFFFGGQALAFLALSRGDVSIITPVLGSKVIVVALASSLLRVGVVPLQWWLAAALSTTAILLLHLRVDPAHRPAGRTVALALGAATSFSLGDVLLQKWLPAWPGGSFFPPMFLAAALFSFGFVPFFDAPLSRLDGAAWRWLTPGVLLLAVNNAGIVLAIALIGSAAAVNIIYSARGLFSVLLVWWLGHRLGHDEGQLEARVLRRRFLGATLMVAAILLVLI